MANDEPGAEGPFLSLQWRAERNPLRCTRGLDAGSGDPEIAGLHRACELHPLVQGKFAEVAGTVSEPGDYSL